MSRLSGKAVIAAALLLAVGLFAPIPGQSRLVTDLQNLAHAPAFLLVTLWAAAAVAGSGWGRRLTPRGRLSFVAAVMTTFAFGSEALQVPFTRDASWGDVAMDLLGMASGLAFVALGDKRISRQARGGAGVVAAVGVTWMVGAAGVVVAEHVERFRAFPVLMSADDCRQIHFLVPQWSTIQCAEVPDGWQKGAGERAARIDLLPGAWPGFSVEDFRGDWADHRRLMLDFVNPNGYALDLAIRVHDREHNQEMSDRFNRAFRLAPASRNVLRIDLDDIRSAPDHRELDLRRISGIVVFMGGDTKRMMEARGERATFYLVTLALE